MHLTKSELKLIDKFLKGRTLLAFDFDGTLAPIVKYRTKARLSSSTRKLLKTVASQRPVAIVTGRSVADTKVKMKGVRPLIFVGNHGAEIGNRVLVSPRRVKEWSRFLKRALKNIQGADLEDKKFSLSIHYVQSRDKVAANKAILREVRKLKGCKVIGGKHVFNVVDPRAPGKGGALEILLRDRRFERAIFFGDDVTDEHAFRLSRRKVLSVKIGKGRTRAKIILKNQRMIDSFLKLIVKSSSQV